MAAVSDGRITREQLDRSVDRVLAMKQRMGLMTNRYVDIDNLNDKLNDPKEETLAQSVADRAVTLVKDDKHLFPIPKADRTCLVVLGESTFTQRGESLTSTLRHNLRNLRVYVETPAVPDAVLTAAAEDSRQCSQIYVAAFITVSANRGGVGLEGGLGKFLNKLTQGTVPVALISFGNPYLLRDFRNVSAYAATFSTTQTSENAAARAILGQISISGRLPVTIPGVAKIGDGLDVPARVGNASN